MSLAPVVVGGGCGLLMIRSFRVFKHRLHLSDGGREVADAVSTVYGNDADDGTIIYVLTCRWSSDLYSSYRYVHYVSHGGYQDPPKCKEFIKLCQGMRGGACRSLMECRRLHEAIVVRLHTEGFLLAPQF